MREELKSAIKYAVDMGWFHVAPQARPQLAKLQCCALYDTHPARCGSFGINIYQDVSRSDPETNELTTLKKFKYGENGTLNVYMKHLERDDESWDEPVAQDYIKEEWDGIPRGKLGSINIYHLMNYIFSTLGVYRNSFSNNRLPYSAEEKSEVLQYLKELLAGQTIAAVSKTKSYDSTYMEFFKLFKDNIVFSSKQFLNSNHTERHTNSLVLHILEF
jgi:hypothetical protein